MKTVRLKGGLGNQLYQIAAINSFCKDNNYKFFIDYGIRFGCGQGKHPSTYKDNLYKNFETKTINPDEKFKLIQETNFRYTPFTKTDDNVVYDGYFQTFKYFEKYKNELNDWFNFNSDLTGKIQQKLDSIKNKTNKKIVGVHVRRGDYTYTPNIHPTVPKKFYDQAKEMFPNHIFLYATDDLTRTSADFKFDDENIYINGKDELEDFITLSLCDSLIIGNSSFAAWASYLGNKKEQIIAPTPWFGPEGPDFTDLLDNNWKIVNT